MTKSEVKDIIARLILQLGRFPKIQEIADALGTSVYQTQGMLKSLVNDGFLVMQGNWYRLAPQENPGSHKVAGVVYSEPPPKVIPEFSTTLEIPVTNESPIEIPPEVIKTTPKEKLDWTIWIIRGCMGFVGVGALLVSLYYTYIWLIELLPGFLALLLASIMVIFSVFAFEIVLLFVSKEITDKGWRWLVAFCFLVLWFIVATFSITSTIAGQYNQNATKLISESKKNLGVTVGREQWQLITDKQDRVKEQIAEEKQKRSDLRATLPDKTQIKTDPKKRKEWDSIQWQITVVTRDINTLNKTLDIERTKKEAQLALNPESTDADKVTGQIPDFYGWIAKVFHKNRESVQFWMCLFPAVFVDIISPAALAIALFLRRRKKII